MLEWSINYFDPMEYFLFWSIICSMAGSLFIACCLWLSDFVKWLRKTPDQRALDWVNAQIEKDKKYKENRNV